jgi:hypothetical protein
MTNYIKIIEDDLRRLYDRASKLKVALEVLEEYKSQRDETDYITSRTGTPALPRIKGKITGRNFGKNMYMRTKQMVLTVMAPLEAPVKKPQIDALVREHMQVSNNLLWKVLRDLRNEGTVEWDEQERLYTLSAQQKQVKRAV